MALVRYVPRPHWRLFSTPCLMIIFVTLTSKMAPLWTMHKALDGDSDTGDCPAPAETGQRAHSSAATTCLVMMVRQPTISRAMFAHVSAAENAIAVGSTWKRSENCTTRNQRHSTRRVRNVLNQSRQASESCSTVAKELLQDIRCQQSGTRKLPAPVLSHEGNTA